MKNFGAWRRTGVFLLPLLLAGCLTSKGRFLPIDTASTPLPAGKYYRIEPGGNMPGLAGPLNLTVSGKVYTLSNGRDSLKFHLIRVAAGKDIYVAQTDLGLFGPKSEEAGIQFLFGPLTEDGFCDYSDPENGFPGVSNSGEVKSKEELHAWLVGHVDDITKLKRGVCWVKLTPDSPPGKQPPK